MLNRVRFRSRVDNTNFLDAHISEAGLNGGYTIKGIEGIGPVKAEVSYSDYALLPGGVFHSANVGVRNIVATIGISPNYTNNQTVESMRSLLYSVFPVGGGVSMSLYLDGTYTSYINTIVESVEPNIFTVEPTVQVSLIAVSPYFNQPTATNIDTFTTGQNITVEYEGNVEVGLTVTYTLASNSSFVQFRNVTQDETIRVNRSFTTGQKVVMNTRDGEKDVVLRSASDAFIERLLGNTVVTNGWPRLKPGTNVLLASQQTTPSSPIVVNYREQYAGY